MPGHGPDLNTLNSHAPPEDNSNVAMGSPLMSPPPLQSANDYGIETICQAPKLVKSLMHRKVIRISSGGVHNICIVESKPSCILTDVYHSFMNGKFTDIVFKGFFMTQQPKQGGAEGTSESSSSAAIASSQITAHTTSN